ncbi:MAG: hypothetical protein EAZ21_02645 [Betaproteobacteria bacterium]|nr:MAG: hypothetical protein EAZ21_02645 [Betaproteobacteria bacterium]
MKISHLLGEPTSARRALVAAAIVASAAFSTASNAKAIARSETRECTPEQHATFPLIMCRVDVRCIGAKVYCCDANTCKDAPKQPVRSLAPVRPTVTSPANTMSDASTATPRSPAAIAPTTPATVTPATTK